MRLMALVVWVWPLLAGARTPVDPGAAEAAVAAAPDRPGLRLVLAEQLLAAGELERARAEAEAVLARWPTASRARLLLARVARARGDEAEATRHLAWIAAHGPRLVRLEAQHWAEPPSDALHLGAWGRLGAQYDDRAVSTGTLELLPPSLGDDPAVRLLAGAGVGLQGSAWFGRLGLERSVHLPTDGGAVAGLDRSTAWAEVGRASGTTHRLTATALAQATLAGRDLDFAHAGGGLGLSYSILGPVRPTLRLRALGLAADERALAWLDGEAELASRLGPLAVAGEVGGGWLGPDVAGGGEGRASLRVALPGRIQPYLAGGAGRRTDDRGLRPHALAGALARLSQGIALRLEGGWQRLAGQDRLVAGWVVEVIQ